MTVCLQEACYPLDHPLTELTVDPRLHVAAPGCAAARGTTKGRPRLKTGKPYQPRPRKPAAEIKELEDRAATIGKTIAVMRDQQYRLLIQAQMLRTEVG